MGLPEGSRLSRRDLRGATGFSRVRQSSGPVTVSLYRSPVPGPAADVASTGSLKLGFAVGRPVGNAVVRNRLRRRLREVLREALPQLSVSAPSGVTLVLVSVRPEAVRIETSVLREHVTRSLLRGLNRVGSTVSPGARS